MSDLISRSELLRGFMETTPFGCGSVGIKFVDDLIKNQPTAYDVDKVVERLEEKLTEVENELDNLKNVCTHILLAEREHLLGRKIAYATAIDIIRAGGKE